jgi:glycine cleavage system regulatory protein
MTTGIVFTVVGDDKPGLVDKLAQIVANNSGNWLESRMSELAGLFAGIVHVSVGPTQLPGLRAALEALNDAELKVVVAVGKGGAGADDCRQMQLSIVGNDRPGIVREVASALAGHRINVREMNTAVTSAPMSGDALFTATAKIDVPLGLNMAELQDQLNAIADALTIDIDLDETPG